MDEALYGPDGFYQRPGAGAGRRRDFLTSPEVGPLFGALLGRALDTWWDELGRPEPFTVYDVGAGPGTLGRSIRRAQPRCGPALDHVLVDCGAGLAAERADTGLRCLGALPDELGTAVVIANELLDNLPVDIAVRHPDAWSVVRVADGKEVLDDADEATRALLDRVWPDAPAGVRVPVAVGARRWLTSTLDALDAGRVLVIDYGASTPELGRRQGRWLRAYADHAVSHDPLVDLGHRDITADVPVDQLADVRAPDLDRSQADALVAWGLPELVDEGRRRWEASRSRPDLDAMEGRSRVTEAEALTDPMGLGGFRVLEWVV